MYKLSSNNNSFTKHWAVGLLTFLLVLLVGRASAETVAEAAVVEAGNETAEQSAHQVVEAITVDLLALIQGAQEYVDEDEQRFFTELDGLLRPFVDFRSFARAVMGRHASSKKMAALDEAGREQLNMQIDHFSDVFSNALIQTYGKGLLAFEGERIEVVPPDPEAAVRPGKAAVKQLIYGEREAPYEIYYSMRQNKQKQWKLRNMVVESINLGKIYRNQFDNAYQVYNGDIDRVIDNWVVAGGDTSEPEANKDVNKESDTESNS